MEEAEDGEEKRKGRSCKGYTEEDDEDNEEKERKRTRRVVAAANEDGTVVGRARNKCSMSKEPHIVTVRGNKVGENGV